ncbi:MAG: 4-hydroxythreonine-4-phosphate dehydrogenase PdxA [Alphaproteobacteria bacterium TMED87]|nr:4-hydroxythreonine-4-phosphate dehydrogenase PdxA [Rhodospirillaceae bacterium]OUV10122.1 MAG: 4-hydroxythreonine-4-phosphate dehydrogenase PdxA [Alphaproteobacteria bacterium TMED87]
MQHLPIAVTMGDPAGCGGEITIRSWVESRDKLPSFFLIDDIERLKKLSDKVNINCEFKEIKNPKEALLIFKDFLPVIQVEPPLSSQVILGKHNPLNNPSIISSIETAVKFASNNLVKAIVTNPIFKSGLQNTGFKYSGHTEYLGDLASIKTPPIMMLSTNKAKEPLRVVPITTHISHSKVSSELNKDKIIEYSKRVHRYLIEDFGIKKPKIAISALNPHAGEDGKLGLEEKEIIIPAVEKLNNILPDILGPFPADTLFYSENRKNYDAIICMYHDQALIPLKTIDFFGSVNITLGLPFIRTSPDHGTAFDLVGKNSVRNDSFISALQIADKISLKRFSN